MHRSSFRRDERSSAEIGVANILKFGVLAMNLLKRIFWFLGLGLWYFAFFLWHYFNAHGMRTSDSASGRVYPLNTHGSVVYLTWCEHYFLYGLMLVSVVFFLLPLLFIMLRKKDGSFPVL
jgi:hypothetical protein